MRRCIAVILVSISTAAIAENTFQEISDPMTDVRRGIAAVNVGGKITPVVKCDKSGPDSLYISFIASEFLGAVRYKTRNIKVRFDGSEPYDVPAYHDGRTASILSLKPGTKAGQILTDMMTGKKMVVQLTTYDYDTVTDAFDLGNAPEIIKKAIATCGDTNW